MPTGRKEKTWPTHPMDPELRAQVVKLIESYTTGKYKMVWSAQPADQQPSDDITAAMMQATQGFLDAYDKGELSPSMQKKILTLFQQLVSKFPV
jgi:hypothetical protein